MVQSKALRILNIFNGHFEFIGGELYCKRAYNKRPIGLVKGCLQVKGYVYYSLKGESVMKHQLIFLLHHDYIPDCLDHIDRDATNNDISNLRDVSKATNSWNRDVQSNSSSGIRGISVRKDTGEGNKKYRAHIMVNKKRRWIGSYKTIEEAQEARESTVKELSEKGEIVSQCLS